MAELLDVPYSATDAFLMNCVSKEYCEVIIIWVEGLNKNQDVEGE